MWHKIKYGHRTLESNRHIIFNMDIGQCKTLFSGKGLFDYDYFNNFDNKISNKFENN